MTITNLYQNFPFMSCVKLRTKGLEWIGIIINLDKNVISLYDFNALRTTEEKSSFLELGEVWWWESNRKLPINIFLRQEMACFKYAIKTFNSKDIECIEGPSVNLSEIAEKRVKRKSITLVKSLRKD